MLIERDTNNGDESEESPEKRLEKGVPRRREVAEVVDAYVGYGGEAESAASVFKHRRRPWRRRRLPHLEESVSGVGVGEL